MKSVRADLLSGAMSSMFGEAVHAAGRDTLIQGAIDRARLLKSIAIRARVFASIVPYAGEPMRTQCLQTALESAEEVSRFHTSG